MLLNQSNTMNPQTILDHWFSPETQPWWFAKSDAFDADIRARFATSGGRQRQANSVTGAKPRVAASLKSSSSTNIRVTCTGAVRSPSRKTAWRSSSRRKSSGKATSPPSARPSANSPCCR